MWSGLSYVVTAASLLATGCGLFSMAAATAVRGWVGRELARRAYSDEDLAWLGFLTKLRLTGMPIKSMREYASLRRLGAASAGRRKAILVEQRASVAERIAELQTCLDILDYKITNYAQLEQRLSEMEPAMEGISA